jgi:hypothetical protein
MNKQRTNIYLPADIKKKAFDLANKGGLSLSGYITQLILRECAIAEGRIKGSLAIFTKTNKKK